MIGCYDFCGHYEWTFEWLRQQGGDDLVHQFWDKAIGQDSQQHAAALIAEKGFSGMKEYWAHTLAEEAAGYTFAEDPGVVRIDMHECPSKGFLLLNGLEQYSDYCDHCIGWIGPMMKKAGFQIHHEHNHCGKCWWEFRRSSDSSPASDTEKLAGKNDVRLLADWATKDQQIDVFRNAAHSTDDGSPFRGRIRYSGLSGKVICKATLRAP